MSIGVIQEFLTANICGGIICSHFEKEADESE